MRRNLLNQLNLLSTRSMVDASLKDTTSMTVSSDRNAMFANRIKDELQKL
jgi:hypothetical protein